RGALPHHPRRRPALARSGRTLLLTGVFQQALYELQLLTHAGDGAVQVREVRFQRLHALLQLPHPFPTPCPPSVSLTLQPPRDGAPERRIEQDRGDGNHQGHEQHDDQDPHGGILRSARPARHLLLHRVDEAGPVADQERREGEHALLRLSPWVDRRAGARDLAHQRLALEALEARDDLLLDGLRARQGRVAGRLYRPLERRVDLHDGLEQAAVLLRDVALQRRERRHRLGWQLVPDEAGLELARPAIERREIDPV